MRHLPLRRAAFLAVLAAGLVGCEGDGGTTVILPPNLTTGRWYLHAANGEDVPALVAERTIGLTAEETHIDSATIDVTAGGWEQRVHLRIMHAGVEDRQETFYDEGTWTRETVGFAFVSTVRSRTFSGTIQPGGALTTTESILSWSGAPTVTGTYRKTPP